ncbi:MAG TPA: hypothetical protein VKD66_20575 [Streptosporangiaceae bacterium]|nr:hypothetical protein [Streptosporangiaceae bacterium]
MNALEDKVRAALRETGAEITQRSVPPLRLRGGRRSARRPGAGGRRWSVWLMPLGAAAAVAAVIAVSLAVPGLIQGRQHADAGPRGPFAGLPPYYIVLTGKNPDRAVFQLQHAEVRATASGAVVTRLAPPPPYNTFSAVAAANDHTFVLAAARMKVTRVDGGTLFRSTANKFFLLRLGAGGHISRLTPLPIPPEPAGADMSGFALTPDGSKFAVALRGGGNGGPGPAIHVFSLPTGTERVWTWPGGGPITNNAGDNGEVLSWTADGRTLAFQQSVPGNDIHLRLLDTTTPGGSLRAASRLLLSWPGDGATWHYVNGKISNVLFGFSAIVTPDGSKIVAATVSETKHPLSSELAFTEFSATTGKVVKVLGRWRLPGLYPGQVQDVLWTNPSGSTLIVLAHKPGAPTKDPHSRNSAGYGIEFGVLRGDRFTPLPGAPSPGPGAWPVW